MTGEELDKLENKPYSMISKDDLATKFAADEIFYDVTKQMHVKLLKKIDKVGSDNDEWEAIKMNRNMKE